MLGKKINFTKIRQHLIENKTAWKGLLRINCVRADGSIVLTIILFLFLTKFQFLEKITKRELYCSRTTKNSFSFLAHVYRQCNTKLVLNSSLLCSYRGSCQVIAVPRNVLLLHFPGWTRILMLAFLCFCVQVPVQRVPPSSMLYIHF